MGPSGVPYGRSLVCLLSEISVTQDPGWLSMRPGFLSLHWCLPQFPYEEAHAFPGAPKVSHDLTLGEPQLTHLLHAVSAVLREGCMGSESCTNREGCALGEAAEAPVLQGRWLIWRGWRLCLLTLRRPSWLWAHPLSPPSHLPPDSSWSPSCAAAERPFLHPGLGW